MAEGNYGERVGALLNLDAAPNLVTKIQDNIQVVATRLCGSTGLAERTAPLPLESSFGIHVHFRESSGGLWYAGKPQSVASRRVPGSIAMVDYEREPLVYIDKPFDMVQFNVPRSALDEVALDNGATKVKNLSWEYGKVDPQMYLLAQCVLPLLEASQHGCWLYVDQLMMAVTSYVAQAYGGMHFSAPASRGSLANWQLCRAKDILASHLDGKVSLSEIARACNLSRSHFTRAFKQSTGVTPIQWLGARRVDKAKDLLADSDLILADIALACGYADQSHFTKMFTRHVGTTPGIWRRCKGNFR